LDAVLVKQHLNIDSVQIAVPQQLHGLRNQPTVTRAMWLMMNGACAAQDCGPVKPSFRLGSILAARQ